MRPMRVSGSPSNEKTQEPINGDNFLGPEVDRSAAGLPRFVKAEANLLRLPLFALHTKHLKALDGIECRGRITRGGETHQYVLRATRNTSTSYPGPLARAAHLAFLSIITEHGLPFENPVSWSWRDLCRRMGVLYGGKTVRELKGSILATALLGIHSEYALYSKVEGKQVVTREEALHLYERVAFVGSNLPDGGIADTNYLWMSDWYLQNLNALFTAPIDYELWRHLDAKSPIASRLYEFLLLNFYSRAPVLRINYETLTQYLPVRPERYRSDAKKQLGGALQLIQDAGLVSSVEWGEGKNCIAQLHLYRGQRLTGPARNSQMLLPLQDGNFTDSIQVKELRNLKPPEWGLVTDFYRLLSGQDTVQPTKADLSKALELLAEHGPVKAKALIPLLVGQLQEHWPDAKTFGAITRYIPDALEEYGRRERREAWEREQQHVAEEEQRKEARRRAEEAEAESIWQGLPEEERDARRQVMVAQHPHAAKHAKLIERFCLGEIIREKKAGMVGGNGVTPPAA